MIPHERIGISTLTWLSQPAEWGIRRAAALGFGWVDVGVIQPMTGLGPAQLADDFETIASRWEAALRETGVGAATFNANIPFDTEKREKQRQATALCEAAARLNVRHGVTLNNGPSDDMTPTVDHLAPILDVFDAHGQTLMVESHRHNWTETPAQAKQLLEALPGLKLTLDAAHFIALGYGPEDWAELLPAVRHCHVRPASRDAIYTTTDQRAAVFDAWLRNMTDADYTGCFTYELIEHQTIDAEAETRRLHTALSEAGIIAI